MEISAPDEEDFVMREICINHIDAFTTKRFAGNPAGVVLNAECLSTQEMQQIANELNLSETVFLLPPQTVENDFRVKYFTPKEEIDFCGHATVALTWLVATEMGLAQTKHGIVLETNIGNIPVTWDIKDGNINSVEMTQAVPKTKDISVDLDKLSRLLRIEKDAFDLNYPLKLANTGNWHLLIPLKNDILIDKADPDLAALDTFNKKYGVSTTHLYTFNTKQDCDLYTRDFAPSVGIAEDPVTGSANGALAGLLYYEKIISQNEPTRLIIGQGHKVERPGTLYVTITPNGTEPIIKVAGAAIVTIKGVLHL